jgi:hypothetical protein
MTRPISKSPAAWIAFNRATFMVAFLILLGAATRVAAQSASVREMPSIKAPRGAPGRAVVFANRGRELVTTTADGVHAWDVATAERRHTWPGKFVAVAASSDGATLAAMDEQNDVYLFDAASRRKGSPMRFGGRMSKKTDERAVLAFARDDKRLAVSRYLDLEIWNLERQEFSNRFDVSRNVGVLSFFPDSKRLLVAGLPTVDAGIWDLETREWQTSIAGYKYVRSAQLSPDGGILAVGIDLFGTHGYLYFLRIDNPRKDRMLRLPAYVNKIAYAPDGRIMAVRCSNGQLFLIHYQSFQIAHTINLQQADEKSLPLGLAFSSDSRFLAADNGGELLVWDLADWGGALTQYENPSDERLELVWRDLAHDEGDGTCNVQPVHQLLAISPRQTVSFLAKKLRPAVRPDPEQVKKWIAELGHAKFTVRDHATNQLRDIGWLAKSALNEALRKESPLEPKRRMERLLEDMDSDANPEHRRQERALWVLAEIDNDAAYQLLRELAGGAPDAYLTIEAEMHSRRLTARRMK